MDHWTQKSHRPREMKPCKFWLIGWKENGHALRLILLALWNVEVMPEGQADASDHGAHEDGETTKGKELGLMSMEPLAKNCLPPNFVSGMKKQHLFCLCHCDFVIPSHAAKPKLA